MNIVNKIIYLIEKKLRIKVIFLFFLILIGTFLETLSVGIVFPILTLIIEGKTKLLQILEKFPSFIHDSFKSIEYLDNELVVLFILIIAVIFFLKTIFFIFLMYYQNKFSYEVEHSLSSKMLNLYLNKNYIFHTEKNSSELFRNVKNEVVVFRHYILISFLTFFIEILVLMSIISLIVYLYPIPALTASIIILFFLFILTKLNKKRLNKISKERQNYDSYTIQHLNQGLKGIKEIKIFNKEKEFLSIFNYYNLKTVKNLAEQRFWVSITKYILEFLGLFFFIILFFFSFNNGHDLKVFLPTAGFIVAAIFKLLPSVNRIVQSVNNIRFGIPSINTLFNELKIQEKEKNTDNAILNIPEKFNKINFTNISFSYPKNEKKIFKNLSFEIIKGDKIGILGSSGAGKSTLIGIITGLLEPSSGVVTIDDQEVNLRQKKWYRKIGYVPQFIFLIDDTILRNIAFGSNDIEINKNLISMSITTSELNKFISSCKEGVNTKVGELGGRISGGQQQRLGIARAIYSNSEILIFDEATSAIDLKTEEKIIENITNLKEKTIILCSHRISTLKNCNKIFEVKEGVINRKK